VSANPGGRKPIPYEEPLLAEIVDADVIDITPPRRRGYVIAILCCVFVLLISISFIAIGIAFISRSPPQHADNFDNAPLRPMPPTFGKQPDGRNLGLPTLSQTRPLSDERAMISAALDGAWHVADDDEKYRDMRTLLSNLEEANTADDHDAFINLVDWSEHMERFYRYYRNKPVDSFAGVQLDKLERKRFAMPLEASNFKIAVVREKSRNDWYVFAYAQEGAMSHVAYLFRMRRQPSAPGRLLEDDGILKLVDWAEVPELHWQAEMNGLNSALGTGDPDFAEEQQLRFDVKYANHLIETGDVRGAETSLRQAEARSGVPQLQDSHLYRIALCWHALNNDTEAERVLSKINNPDDYPCAHQLAATIQFQRGHYAEALEAIERFERSAGFSRETMMMKARCYAALQQISQAKESVVALLRYAPNDPELQALAAEIMPPDRAAQ